MLPGNPRIVTCPFCGAQKRLMTLMSGNTIGAKYWSDNKQEAPMLPKVSYVQKFLPYRHWTQTDRGGYHAQP